MSNSRIAPRNFWDLMTLSGSVAPAAGFEYTNTQNTIRSAFWRSPSTADQYVAGAMATGSFTCNCIAIDKHHCHGGLIRVTFYPNNDFTGTPIYTLNSSPAAIFTAITTGYDHGYADYPSLDTHDPLGLDSMYVACFPSAAAVKSIKIEFSTKSTTYGFSYWEAGRIFVGNYKEVPVNPDVNFQTGIGHNEKGARTLGGTNHVGSGATWNTCDFSLSGLRESEIAEWTDIRKIAKTSADVLFMTFIGVGGRDERDGNIIGKFLNLDPTGRYVNRATTRIQIVGN